jgi:protein-tyrosine phosphatase
MDGTQDRAARVRAGHFLATVSELRASSVCGSRLESFEPITLAGSRTVLVELPFVGWPTYTEQALFDVMAAGYRPLLAHPERYAAALENPGLIYGLHERGVLMQLTTGSLAGLFGKRSREVAEQLLRDGIVDVLASDAHSAGRRFVAVGEGLARAKELIGGRRVQQLTTDNPKALLEDRDLDEPVIETLDTLCEPSWRNSLTRVKHLIHRR